MAIALLLAVCIEKTCLGGVNSIATKHKDRLFYLIIFATLTIFLGLRTRYNDTYNYIIGYSNSVAFPNFWETFNPQLGANPGFTLTQAYLKSKGLSSQSFLLLFSAISIGCSLYFIKHYSNNFVLSLFLYFTTNSYTLTAAAVKQSTAIALSLIAIIFALKKKWMLYAIMIVLAATFHPYVLLYAIVPFLMFKPWTSKTYILLAVFVSIGFALNSLLGTIVDITSMIGDSYSEESFVGEGINIFRVLVANVPLFLTFLYRKKLFSDSTSTEHLMVNLSILNGAIMFVGMFGTAIYFSRMASYFTIMQCVALPWILSKLPKSRKMFYTTAMVIGYCLFFLYANVISQSFDDNFSRITLFDYLKTI